MFAHSLPPGAKLAAYLAAKAMNPQAANSVADPATRKRGSRLATYIAQQEMLGRRIPIYAEDSTGGSAGSAPADNLYVPTAEDLLNSLSGEDGFVRPASSAQEPQRLEGNFVSRPLHRVAGALLDASRQTILPSSPTGETNAIDLSLRTGAQLGGGLAQLSGNLAANPLQTLGNISGDILTDASNALFGWGRALDDAVHGRFDDAGRNLADAAEGSVYTAANFAGGAGISGQTFKQGAKHGVQTAARAPIPTSRQLRNIADDRYLEAQAEGVKASQAQAARMVEDMRTIATRKGMLPPTSSLDAATENVQRVIKTMNAYARGPMTPDNIRAARNTLEDVLENAIGKEREAVRAMLSAFDDFAGMVSPGLREANAKLDRAARLKKLEDRRAVAEANLGKHKHPQYDEALREEYRKIYGNIVDNQLDEFTDEELGAILKVIHGTKKSEIARGASVLAPQDYRELGKAIPPFLGLLAGGPAGGSAIAGAGYLGRVAANRFAKRYADEAQALTATGVPLERAVLMTPEQKRAAAALLSAQIITNGDRADKR